MTERQVAGFRLPLRLARSHGHNYNTREGDYSLTRPSTHFRTIDGAALLSLWGREGAINVRASLDLVLVEGVGAGQRALSSSVDAIIWVQSDRRQAQERGIARDIAEGVNGDEEQTVAFPCTSG